MSAYLESLLTRTQREQAAAADQTPPDFSKPSYIQIAELRLELARAAQRNADLLAELRTAVGSCCNSYWFEGHGQRVQRLYGIENHCGAPDVMDTIRVAHAALTGQHPTDDAIAQCRASYGAALGLPL